MIFDLFRRKSSLPPTAAASTGGVDLETSLRSVINGSGRVSTTYFRKIATSHTLESFRLFVSCPLLVGSGLREGTLLRPQAVQETASRKRSMTLLFQPAMFLAAARAAAEAESLQQAIYPLQKGDDSASPDPNVFTIGREPGSDLVIPDFAISREHAVIRLQSRRIFLSDRGSSNGTIVNGAPIDSGQTEILSGDSIAFGRLEFAVLSAEMLYGILK